MVNKIGHPDMEIGQILTDLLGLQTPSQPASSRKGRLSERVMTATIDLVDKSGLIAQWEEWYQSDNPESGCQGGRPGTVTSRQILVVLIALVISGEAPLVTNIAEAIHLRLSTKVRRLLGLPDANWRITEKAIYHRCYRKLHWLLNTIDPYPGQRYKRTSPEERKDWLDTLDPKLVQRNKKRVRLVANTLLETSVQLMPNETLQKWNGSISIDATVIRTPGKKGTTKNHRNGNADKAVSPENLAGWYHRDDGVKKVSMWAYEGHLAVMTPAAGTDTAHFPLLVIAMSLDTPASRISENTMVCLDSIRDRGHSAGLLAGD